MSEPAVLTPAELDELAAHARERKPRGWMSVKPEQIEALIAGYHKPAPGAVPWPQHFPMEGA